MEGLDPVYFYPSQGSTNLYTSGNVDLSGDYVRWDANGYRLPTSAEWEKAARGALAGQRFSWGGTISHSQANYWAGGTESYDLSRGANYHPDYSGGSMPYTSPAGSFAANGYGIYDMAGNVGEWCWDWYEDGWYSQPGSTADDPRGPATSAVGRRALRMGNWNSMAGASRCSIRSSVPPGMSGNTIGIRSVRRP
jgi:formylglycine-generating enzyme required for sulfatase activity